MQEKNEKVMQWYAVFAVICLGLVMLTIPARFVTRKLLFERMGISAPWMRVLLPNDTEVADMEENDAEQKVFVDWQQQYPFSASGITEEKTTEWDSFFSDYTSLIQNLQEKIEHYCTENLLFYNQAIAAASELEQAVGCEAENLGGDVIRMNNGYFTGKVAEVKENEIQELADEVADLKQFLDAQGIGFLYGNAGSKVCPYDKQLTDETLEYTNENGTALVDALRENGVSVIDFRDEMQRDGLDWYDSYYKADHHWKTEMGLWAADKLACALNETGRFSFDRAIFAKENYTFETYENCFFGSQARSVTFANADLESYTKILPDFETQFHIQIPTRAVDLQGDYESVLFDAERLKKNLSYTKSEYLTSADTYQSMRARNDALVHIQNLNPSNNAEKKILMLQDSFSWYLTSFLACDIGQIDTIYLSAFTGSLRSYIEQTKPDMVVMLYCERNITPLERMGHNHLFDLR